MHYYQTNPDTRNKDENNVFDGELIKLFIKEAE